MNLEQAQREEDFSPRQRRILMALRQAIYSFLSVLEFEMGIQKQRCPHCGERIR
jgi:hypothetical protein